MPVAGREIPPALRRRAPRLAWLLTAVLLLVSATVPAHELDHALDQHQELCGLHHYAGNQGGLPSAHDHPPVPALNTGLGFAPSYSFVSKTRPAPYAVRAPPLI